MKAFSSLFRSRPPKILVPVLAAWLAGCATAPPPPPMQPAAPPPPAMPAVPAVPAAPPAPPREGPAVYIDAAAGDDANPGTAARPWKTFLRLAGLRGLAGVYLKCGDTFRNSLALGAAQLAPGATIAGYGACTPDSRAVLSGADDFSGGWTQNGEVWSRRVPGATPKITQLFVDGVPLRTAQWPHYGGPGREYATADGSAPGSKTSLQVASADRSQLGGRDIVGATLTVRPVQWASERKTVAAFDPGSGVLTLDSATHYTMQHGPGYLLSDKRWMLGAPGEFFHDMAAGMLYLIPPAGAARSGLDAARIEGTVRPRALELTGQSNLVLRDIAAVRADEAGMTFADTPQIAVDSVAAADNARWGLRVIRNSPAAAVRRSSFLRNGYAAIDASAVPGASISGNTIVDTGLGASAGTSTAAIAMGPGGTAQDNLIRRSAYLGISFSNLDDSKVLHNRVEDSCQRFADGAAIYTFSGAQGQADPARQRALVEDNDVLRAPGDGGDCMGIYVDDLSRHVTVRRNTVTDVPFGIFLHNASDSVVDGNRVLQAHKGGLWLNMDHQDSDVSTGVVFSRNEVRMAAAAPATTTRERAASAGAGSAGAPVVFWHRLAGKAAIANGSVRFVGNDLQPAAGSPGIVHLHSPADGDASVSADDWQRLNPAAANR